jgi:hypothetical protein
MMLRIGRGYGPEFSHTSEGGRMARKFVFPVAILFLAIISTAAAQPIDRVEIGEFQEHDQIGPSGGSGLFVAVGGMSLLNGQVLSSPDGETWTNRGRISDYSLEGIAYGFDKNAGKGGFVAVGTDGIYFSLDAIKWKKVANGGFTSVTYGYDRLKKKGGFVAVGLDGKIYFSQYGPRWTPRRSGVGKTLRGVVYGFNGRMRRGVFVAVGDLYSDLHESAIVTSPDGLAWTRQTSPSTLSSLYNIAYGGGKFVATGDFHGSPQYATNLVSSFGVQWVRSRPLRDECQIDRTIRAITFGNGNFIAISGCGNVYNSMNGIGWSKSRKVPRSGDERINGVTYGYDFQSGRGTFIAVGLKGAVFTCPDGKSRWVRQNSTTDLNLRAIAFGKVAP